MNFIATLLTPFVALGVMIGSLFIDHPDKNIGASEAIPTTIAFFETTLASAISSTATSFTLTSATDKDGTTLASSTYAFVIDEGSSNEEIVIADCTATACTNALRGVSARTGNTEVTALKKSHRRGASVKMTDAPILPLVARALRGDAVVNFTPDSNYDLATKSYVDSLSLGSTTVSASYSDDGIAELATGVEAASSTATGGSGSPLVLHTGISTSTAPSTGSYVVVTGADGNIADGLIDSTIYALVASSTAVVNVYTASSTWTKPTGTYNFVKIELWGGGGSGAADGENDATSGAGGGGGGAYASIILPYSSVSATSAVVIGAGGAAKTVSATVSGAGNAGGNTSFGSYLTVYGGGAGYANGDNTQVSGGGGGGVFGVGGNGGAGSAGTAGSPGTPLHGAGGVNATAPINYMNSGGGGASGSSADDGSNVIYGGAGGAGCDTDSNAGNGGTSAMGGNGGAAGQSGNGTAGSSKGGGGGAGCKLNAEVTSGAGGDGYARITTF